MSWKSYLFPQTMCITASSYNAHIRVNEEWGKMKLLVNGSPQSGTYIEGLWKSAFGSFSIRSKNPKSVLVLGIGGGTVNRMLSEYFPGIVQTVVDIDPVIIDIAKKYFFVDCIPNTHLVCSDAKEYVRQSVLKGNTYDFIIVDLSFGRVIPSFVTQKQFLQNLNHLLANQGFLCINYLREKEYKDRGDQFFRTLLSLFPIVTSYEIARNRFYFSSI